MGSLQLSTPTASHNGSSCCFSSSFVNFNHVYFEKHYYFIFKNPDEYTGVGATQFVADTAKEGVRKATQVADTIGDAAKETMDGAREAAKEANQKIRETVGWK